jgi:hypothetical protein
MTRRCRVSMSSGTLSSCTRIPEHVDGLVGQEAVGDVAVAQLRRDDQRPEGVEKMVL